MRIGAYQFSVTGNIEKNFSYMKGGIDEAEEAGVRLLVFPECALTGYPPHCVKSASDVDFETVKRIHDELQLLAEKANMYLVVGTIVNEASRYYNSAVVFRPDGKRDIYSNVPYGAGTGKTLPKEMTLE